MIDVKIDFDAHEFYRFTEMIGSIQIQNAMNRAVRKAALWVRTHLLRRIKDEGIRRKIIASRVRIYNKDWRAGVDGGKAVKVWFGIDPVFADRIGKPVKTPEGYRIGARQFPGAFIPKNGRYAGKMYQRTTSKRMPIMRSRVEIDEQANRAFDEISAMVPARLNQLVLQELRYEVFKATGA
jgi:hypothetical protein